MLGVKLMARINNVGVIAELIGSTLLVILLLFHVHRGPQVIVHSYGSGAGHAWGYFGAFLSAASERVRDVRVRHRGDARRGDQRPPQARAAGDHPRDRGGGAHRRPADPVRVDGEQATSTTRTSDSSACRTSSSRRSATPLGDIFLADSAIAIIVCCLACTGRASGCCSRWRATAGCRSARRSPACLGPRKVPIVPALVIGACAGAAGRSTRQPERVLRADRRSAIIMFYLAYLGVTVPMLARRLRGDWPRADHGPYFSLGRWGLPVNIVGGRLRHARRDQHRLAARRGLRLSDTTLVLPVGRGRVHRRRRSSSAACTTSWSSGARAPEVLAEHRARCPTAWRARAARRGGAVSRHAAAG